MALDPAGFQQAMDPEAVEPASWMTTTLAAVPRRCSALVLNRARRSSSAAPSPASTECFDILSRGAAIGVMSHLDRLSSRDTSTVA